MVDAAATPDAGQGMNRRASDAVPPWPPPALERIQGDLYGVAARGALAGAFMVLPLLFVVTRDAEFATLGPLADAWWVTVVLATVGLAFALDAIGRAARTLRRASRGVEAGYSLTTVLQVLADTKRDTGFLLAGARYFSQLEESERRVLARRRVVAGLALALAGLWCVVAFSIGLFFAARGLATPLALEVFTLGPAVAAYLVGGVAYLLEEARVRKARKTWYAQPRSSEVVDAEIRSWRERAATSGNVATVGDGRPDAKRATVLARAGLVVGAVGILVALPVFTLVPASAIGPVLSTVSAPGFDGYRPRAARSEAYRSYAAPAEPSVSPQEAGRLLQAVTLAGADTEPRSGELAADPLVAEPWIPRTEGPPPLGIEPPFWGDSIFQRVAEGLSAEERAYLVDVAEHPLAGTFARLARAPALDAASGRWESPFPTGLTMATLPVPPFGALRSAASARIAAAALAFAEGRADDAELYLSEVLAVGFLLVDDGPTLIDNFVGYAIVEAGGAALGHYFRVAGRVGESAQLSRLRQVADRGATMMTVTETRGRDAWIRSLPDLVLDTTLVRGVRWEYFINLATMAPCLNVSRMVFGADQGYQAFVDSAQVALVRWPSEEPLFDLARRGWVGSAEPVSKGVLEGIAGLYMSTGENSCASSLSQIPAPGF